MHFYDDVSNLNAPYDVVPLQGLGSADDPQYPWRTFSAATKAMQRDLNDGLTEVGGCLVLEDGIMGPRTCGALSYFGEDHKVSTCALHRNAEPYIMPTIPCPANTSPQPEPILTGDQDDTSDVEYVEGTVSSGTWLFGALFGIGAISIAWYLTRKDR